LSGARVRDKVRVATETEEEAVALS
jgi:hypothetical protein